MQVDIVNVFNNVSVVVIFKELCDAKGPLASMSILLSCLMVHILLFTTNMGSMWRGSPLWSHLQVQGKVAP
jgi:hypothetical protein